MTVWLIGIDEAGRGPLAGPVAVGLVRVPANFNWAQLPGVGDSKALSEAKRVAVAKAARALRRAGGLDFTVVQVGPATIDRDGIAPAIRGAIARGLARLVPTPGECFVRLDGALRAPAAYAQETIIKGDASEPVIGLASILAKVTRDAYMVRLAARPEYAPYGFAIHKGYGTKAHRAAIATHGLSDVHRRSYCRNIEVL